MKDLKQSIYNVLFDDSGKYYLYNTLSVGIVELDSETYNCFKEDNISAICPDYIPTMQEMHFLVEKNADEPAEYLYYYNRIRFGCGAQLLSINFAPSFACNLACPYCFQGQDKDIKAMKLEDVDKVIKFAEKRILASLSNHNVPIKQINANMYGGEPLLQKQALIKYCDGMYKLSKKYDCKIRFMMTSNFTLLDEDLLNLIDKYKIYVQVSIDGTKEEHDKRRIYKSGKGTYDTIIKNLKKMKERHLEDYVVIRLNVDKNNVKYAESIINNVKAYSTDIYFGLLEQYNGFNDCFADNCIGNESVIRARRSNELASILVKYGYRDLPLFGKIDPCAIGGENKFCVDCDLNLFTCELGMKQIELSVGKISDDGDFLPNNNYYKMMNHSPALFQKCMKCKLMPMCAGGCSAKAYLNDGDFNGELNRPYCMLEEEELKEYLKFYVKRMYE